ncbi:hypothetical protein RERY_02580 [Rhodococcus erythropolis]|nr:hypothetical protein RERY_02580 [Rhodococcus erythropolis]
MAALGAVAGAAGGALAGVILSAVAYSDLALCLLVLVATVVAVAPDGWGEAAMSSMRAKLLRSVDVVDLSLYRHSGQYRKSFS